MKDAICIWEIDLELLQVFLCDSIYGITPYWLSHRQTDIETHRQTKLKLVPTRIHECEKEKWVESTSPILWQHVNIHASQNRCRWPLHTHWMVKNSDGQWTMEAHSVFNLVNADKNEHCNSKETDLVEVFGKKIIISLTENRKTYKNFHFCLNTASLYKCE